MWDMTDDSPASVNSQPDSVNSQPNSINSQPKKRRRHRRRKANRRGRAPENEDEVGAPGTGDEVEEGEYVGSHDVDF